MVGLSGPRISSPSQQANSLVSFKSSASPALPAPPVSGGGPGGPTPDHYFRNVAAMSGLNPYSYEAAAAAAACAWAGRLGHHAAQHPSSLSRSSSHETVGFSPAGLSAAASSAFRRSGRILERFDTFSLSLS